jgi:hypothetical protein
VKGSCAGPLRTSKTPASDWRVRFGSLCLSVRISSKNIVAATLYRVIGSTGKIAEELILEL